MILIKKIGLFVGATCVAAIGLIALQAVLGEPASGPDEALVGVSAERALPIPVEPPPAFEDARLMVEPPVLNEGVVLASSSRSSPKPMLLNWEDLMPEGEEERLAALYEEYFAQVEADLARAQPQTLSQASPLGAIEEGSEFDTMEQIGTFNVVEDLNGKTVRLPGFVVPFDFSVGGKYSEFLLVPYFGACIHTPPPPPNQIVYVKAEPRAEIVDIWVPVWVEGVLTTRRKDSDIGDSAYTLTLTKIEPYDF
jgi:hypothetical protein